MFDHAPVTPTGDHDAFLPATAPIDRAKVERLRRQIADGTYVVDPDAVAAAIIAAHLPDGPTDQV